MPISSEHDQADRLINPPESWIILNYHRVGPPARGARYRGMFVTAAHLRSQIRWLRRQGFHILPVAEALTCGLQKVASLSFDDGYEDNLREGFPVLRSEGVRASLYLVTGDVGKKQHSWNEAGERLAADLLDWDQVQLLRSNGWEIGSHGRDHIHLGRKSLQEQECCLHQSVDDIESILGERPLTLAYPYGSYGPESLQAARDAGFLAALTTEQGLNSPQSDLLRLRRIPLRGYRWHHHLWFRRYLNSLYP
ncbi:MAG: polysaccharide deacetylase family protein [Deltaproteobacteria bacterium]|nr:polysaccharide deacetylase family protein [Deltaproteobacteria bacterium]